MSNAKPPHFVVEWAESPSTAFGGSGPWQLPVSGFQVMGLWLTYPLDLFAYGDEGTHMTLMLSAAFDYSDTEGEIMHFNAETDAWRDLAPLFDLRYDQISEALLSADSELRIRFESGRQLIVPPDEEEAWEAWAPGVKVVGTGGEPMIWTGKAWDQVGGLARTANPRKIEDGVWWSQEGERALSRFLRERWNPIGDDELPSDEYAGYTLELGRMLRAGLSEAKLAAYLSSVRVEAMGLPPNATADMDAAQELTGWFYGAPGEQK